MAMMWPLDVPVEGADVFLLLFIERFAGFGDLMAVVEVLDGLLEADGEEEADDDGADVDEEVCQVVVGLLRGVDVEHGMVPCRALKVAEGRRCDFGRVHIRRQRSLIRVFESLLIDGHHLVRRLRFRR